LEGDHEKGKKTQRKKKTEGGKKGRQRTKSSMPALPDQFKEGVSGTFMNGGTKPKPLKGGD